MQEHSCSHRGEALRVGDYEVLAAGTDYLQPGDPASAAVVVPLEADIPGRLGLELGQSVEILGCPGPNFHPPPDRFKEFLIGEVIPRLEQGKQMIIYCIRSHGRKGTFLA